MTATRKSSSRAFTLVELMATIAIGFIITLTVSMLIYGGQRQWAQAYYKANIGTQIDALKTMIAFGSMGRKANKSDYVVYKASGGSLTKVLPPTGEPISLVVGDAIEFRGWDKELCAEFMDSSKTASQFALLYLDGTTLKLNLGPYDSLTKTGGVDSGGQRTGGPDVTTNIVAEHVTNLSVSHTTRNADGDGNGCVRLTATFTDPRDGGTITIKAATLMRNVWP